MKTNAKYERLSVMHTVLELYTMKELARATAKHIAEAHGDSVEVQDVKNSGFIFRRKKDSDVSNSDISSAMATAIEDLLNDRLDETLAYMSEEYDLIYDSSVINDEFIKELFDISRSGRLIYIEIDT